ncbi:thiol-disulfide oxidoreductase DCC family protein [Tahibacter harae]|uniref:DUF393 domain-containing protein n=1 Tax=Tahibacter harae TaxID=2963937 RepID=A0ABT1QRW8_9GAMM|nr:DUF393 domain-containing protein [Tahibacter harae]MCQ4165023.1 DUF393 domain-containing protein [Tahibacter harae]
MSALPPITVFFDSYCPVCRREVASHRRRAPDAPIVWRDLATDPAALAGQDFGLDAALALLHVRDAQGRLHIGLAAHLQLWERLPGWRHLAAALQRLAWLQRPLEMLYRLFTRHRPGLARRRRERRHG